MAETDNKNFLPHIVVHASAKTERFLSPKSGRDNSNVPARARGAHSRHLQVQLTQIQQATEADLGLQIEFASFEGVDLATQSLARDKSGIELLNVREDAGKILATVFVPSGKLQHFEKLVAQYVAHRRGKSGQAIDNRKLVDAIDVIRLATVNALWTDTSDALPESKSQPIAWEVWLPVRRNRAQVIEEFRELGEHAGWKVSGRVIEFPERSVLVCIGTQAQLESSVRLLSLVAELRRAKETAAFFDELNPVEQDSWVADLQSRLQIPSGQLAHICILDTGINRGHPLLAASLSSQDLHTTDPAWTTGDEHGHGSQLAGLSLFGDLVDALDSSGPVAIPARLESVKILRKSGDNAGESYGAIVQEAVGRVEITDPQRSRIFNLAVTATDTRDRGRASSWSSSIDSLAADAAGDGANPRLFVVSAGNCSDPNAWLLHPTHLASQSIHDPGQSWNALTVGAFTEKIHVTDDGMDSYKPVGQAGSLSPFTTSSSTWPQKGNAWKPDVVAEGGNVARDRDFASEASSLSLLTTHHLPLLRAFTTSSATSAATALVSRLGAEIRTAYTDFWPETVRALVVHSARWPDQMQSEFFQGTNPTMRKISLLRHCGYGVPNRQRALWSANDSLTLIVQDALQPFEKSSGKVKTRDMHIHELPWPASALEELGEHPVSLRVTLSYFVEPNPGARGTGDKYMYHSHGLRFEVRRPTEKTKHFLGRINRLAQDEEEGTTTSSADTGWFVGDMLRRRGSIHSDVWTGTAAELARRGMLAIYPAVGWWRRRAALGRVDREARYSLIVSIEAPEVPIDLYALVKEQIDVGIAV